MQKLGRDGSLLRHHGLNNDWATDGNQGVDALQAPDPIAVVDTGPEFDLAATATPANGSVADQADGISLGPTAGGLAMVDFITGLNSSGAEDRNDPNFWDWNGNIPPTYQLGSGSGYAHEWVPGSTVTYWFDPASNWTPAEEASFTDALNQFSAVANIGFTLSTASSEPSDAIDITRGNDGGAETTVNYSFSTEVHMGLITGATTSIDTSVSGWNALGSFSATGGYGIQTVLHEMGTALGLGRPGPYNGTEPSAQQVIYTTDTRQYSVMSYVDAGSALANQVATTNGNTPSPANYDGNYLTTLGQYDILAIQQLYGAAKSGPLTVGETFGFNASAVLKSSMPSFDFTVNTNPVVTIYDSGTGNTLDLSGFSTPSTVDLNPGQFSSADGMVDNIGIAFNTWIDTAIGGSGNDTFYVNAQADTIDGGGGSNTVVFGSIEPDYKLAVNGGTITVSTGGITDTLTNIQTLQFAGSDASVLSLGLACFARGTRILTPGGEVAVEALREGDVVCTAAGAERPVKWIGRRTIDLLAHPQPRDAAPIRIRRDAFGDRQPRCDLLLSPEHAVLVGKVLIPAKLLVNGCTVVQDLAAGSVSYLHLELDRHDVVLAEGLAVESYLDTGNRAMFENGGMALILHPDCSVRSALQNWESDACAPLAVVGAELQAARQHLLARALAQGCRMVDDPCVRLGVDGREIAPLAADGGRCVFALPAQARRVEIRSRTAIPTEVGARLQDNRRLGVAVARMILMAGPDRREIPVDHPNLRQGWHAVERQGGRSWRWTDGAALVPLPLYRGAGSLLEIGLQSGLTYLDTPASPRRNVA